MSGKDEIAKIVFFAMERANAGTDDMRSNILIQQVNRSLFIVGNWKRQIRHHRESATTFH